MIAVESTTATPESDSSHKSGWIRRLEPFDAVFVGICLVVAVARYRVLVRGGAPPTIDAGNWLAFGHSFVGGGVRDASIVYPPLVPLLVLSVVRLIGVVRGVAMVAVLSSLAPSVGVYPIVRAMGLRWRAVVICGCLTTASSVGEATAWGGFPQLIGLGLLPGFLWYWDRFLDTRQRRDAVAAGGLLGLALAVTHFVAAIAMGAALLMAAYHLCRATVRHDWRLIVRRIWPIPLICAPLVPIYWRLAGGIGGSVVDGPANQGSVWRDLVDNIEFLYRDFPLLWRVLIFALPAAAVVLIDQHTTRAWRVTVAWFVSSMFAQIVLDTRAVYMLPSAAVLAAGLWLSDQDRVRAAVTRQSARFVVRALSISATALLVVALAVQMNRGIAFFEAQRNYYGALDTDLVDAISWTRRETPRNAVVAMPSLQNAPVGWWIEGLGERRSYVGSSLKWLNFEDERQRASVANEIFDAFPTPKAFELARMNKIVYLLVPRRWEKYATNGVDDYAVTNPALVVYENRSVRVFAVGG